MKKARLIAIVILGLLTVGGLVFFFKPSSPTTTKIETTAAPGNDPMNDELPPQGFEEEQDAIAPPPSPGYGDQGHDQDADIPPMAVPPQNSQNPSQNSNDNRDGSPGQDYGNGPGEPPRMPPIDLDNLEDLPPIEDAPQED